MDIVGVWRAKVQDAREHGECVVQDFFEAVSDDDALPSGSDISDSSDASSDGSAEPDQREGRTAEDAKSTVEDADGAENGANHMEHEAKWLMA